MHKKIILLITLFTCFENKASEVSAELRTALVQFYDEHNLPASHISFISHESYFRQKPGVRAYTNSDSLIALSPDVQKSLLQSIAENKPFFGKDQVTLLHEYGHIKQDEANRLLEKYKDQIPFIISTQQKKEIAADFWALTTMKPDALSSYLKETENFFRVNQERIRRTFELRAKIKYLKGNPLRHWLSADIIQEYEDVLENLFAETLSLPEISTLVGHDNLTHATHAQLYYLLQAAHAIKQYSIKKLP